MLFRSAKSILKGNYDDAIAQLRQLPQYASIADPQMLRRQFIEDAAGSGILQTLASSDLVTSNRTGSLSQLVPGITPMTRMDAAKELVNPEGWKNFFQIKDIRLPWQSQSAYETLNPVLNASQKLSDFVDSTGRLGGYISLLRQGLSPQEAAKRITGALVDYSSLTSMERGMIRPVFMWWAYNSRIGKYAVQSLMNNPGGSYAQMIRALNTIQSNDSGETYIPTALRQQFAVRIPDALKPYLGAPQDDTGEYVFRNFDAPGVDVLSIPAPSDTFGGFMQETMFNILNQASPLVRVPMEIAFDTDSFTRRPLKDAVTPLDKIYKRVFNTPYSLDPTLRAIINNIPGVQRPINFIGGFLDDKDDQTSALGRGIKQGFNTLSGASVQRITPAWVASDLERAIASRLRPYTRTVPNTFIPKDIMPHVAPADMPYVLLSKSVKKKNTARNKEERKKREEASK